MKTNIKILVVPVIFGGVLFTASSFVYASSGLPLDPVNILNRAFSKSGKNIGTTAPTLPGLKFSLPGNSGNSKLSNLLNTENFSSKDLGSTLKAVAVLAINLFLIIIETVAGILKALLPFLQ